MKAFPKELLSKGAIIRRFALAGIEATKRLTEEEVKLQARELRSSQHVAGPEGD